MKIKPFKAWRPHAGLEKQVASVPYDVVNTDQARALAEGNPLSFLHAVRAEIDLPAGTNPYSEAVYTQAKANLETFKRDRVLVREEAPCFYLYSQAMNGHRQYGLVATCHVDDYEQGRIKIHEKTRRAKEEDRIRYVETQNANTGPVFLAFRSDPVVSALLDPVKQQAPLYDFTAADGVRHTVWRIEGTAALTEAFAAIPAFYVADGHHRSASAVQVARRKRAANPGHTGLEPYNWFMAVIFPADELKILPYNRVVLNLNGLTGAEFTTRLSEAFTLTPAADGTPARPGEIRMYFNGVWQTLVPKMPVPQDDPVAALDVSVLQDRVLAPLLGIDDPRESERIDFVGGIHGTAELERRVNDGESAIAFSMFPTSMDQLFAVADAGLLMPPKSTWFEPKLRSGLLVNTLD
jgi:uncharacterized protein (DUF1015 family)